MSGFCKLGHIHQSLHSIPYVRKFWSGKILANKLSHLPILPAKRLLFSISLSYTYSLFTNILHSNWFRLFHSPMLYPTKFPHVQYVHAPLYHACIHLQYTVKYKFLVEESFGKFPMVSKTLANSCLFAFFTYLCHEPLLKFGRVKFSKQPLIHQIRQFKVFLRLKFVLYGIIHTYIHTCFSSHHICQCF